MDKIKETIIQLLQEDKQLPIEFQEYLFPVNHKEYQLAYRNKEQKQKILSLAEEPQSIPFQKIKQFGEETEDWSNLLIFGDNFQVLKTFYENKVELIRNKVKGKVKLIYIDPPFATTDEFYNKEGAKAYSDKIKGAEFIEFVRQRLILAKEILADDGTIMVHLDAKMSHYIKVVMDEVFGKNSFINEIIWGFNWGGHANDRFAEKHNTIFWYGKEGNKNHTFNADAVREPYKSADTRWHNNKEGKIIRDLWDDIPTINTQAKERTGYPTQKPEALLERIILATTNPGDLVMDFFGGSGTTGIVAERLGRRWIMCDIGKLSLHTIKKRLLTQENGYKPFSLINAGCYDLRLIFGLSKEKYVNFVKDLFHIELQEKQISGIKLDGKRRGDWVKIYDYQEMDGDTTAINEEYIEELHKNIGKKIGHKFYIVAPEMNIDVIGDYYQIEDVKYYLLRIPYLAIKELHKMEFKKAEQPRSAKGVNSVEHAVGFFFNEQPQVDRDIDVYEDNVVVNIKSVTPEYESLQDSEEILAMVLVDSSNNKEFVMQDVYFADEIKNKKGTGYTISLRKSDLQTKTIKLIYIDIFGNETEEKVEI